MAAERSPISGPRYRSVLLASHGTAGAQAAERMALAVCAAGGALHQLLVVPDLWRGMMGDDWLNNARTRIRFGKYLEGQLSKEVDEHFARLHGQATQAGLDYRPRVQQGDPTDCLIELLSQVDCEVLVMGAPRPKGSEGLRSRVQLDRLLRAANVPVIIVPLS